MKGKRWAMVIALAAGAIALAPEQSAAAGGYTAGGGPWNVRECATTSCRVVGSMPNGPIPDLACQVWGERVILGGYITNIWNKVRTPSGAVGYMTDAGVNETPGGTEFDPRLPRCGGTHGGSVYFKPRGWQPLDPKANADYVMDKDDWSSGDCGVTSSGNFPDVIDGKLVTTLAGWSVGRLAPTYLMYYNFARVRANIDSIILYDPGNVDDYFGEGSCDPEFDQAYAYAAWLQARVTNRLLILAGDVTRDAAHPDAFGVTHQGIRRALFTQISGTPQAQQVLICNYDDLDHVDVLRKFADVVRWGSQYSCPRRDDVVLYREWHP
jgi:hypothetical protein